MLNGYSASPTDMTRSLALASLLAASLCLAQGAPAPAADAGRPRKSADGGTAARPAAGSAPAAGPAGAADAGAPSKPRPAFALAKDSATLEKWSKTPPAGRAALPTLKGVKIGERAFLGIFLENWELPQNRKVDLSADLLITDCNKRIVFERANVAGTRSTDPKVNLAVQLSPAVELLYGLTDPDCTYQVKVTVFDLMRGGSWSSEGSFAVTR